MKKKLIAIGLICIFLLTNLSIVTAKTGSSTSVESMDVELNDDGDDLQYKVYDWKFAFVDIKILYKDELGGFFNSDCGLFKVYHTNINAMGNFLKCKISGLPSDKKTPLHYEPMCTYGVLIDATKFIGRYSFDRENFNGNYYWIVNLTGIMFDFYYGQLKSPL